MKKFLAVVILVVISLLFAALLPVRLYAAAGDMAFSIGSVGDLETGQTITVPISVNNNQGFTAVGLELSYDPDVLEIIDVTALVADMPLNPQFALTAAPGNQWIHLVNTNTMDWSGNGVVANVTFRVKSNAAAGTSPIDLGFTNSPDGTPANVEGTKFTEADTFSQDVYVVNNTDDNNDNDDSDNGSNRRNGSDYNRNRNTQPNGIPPATPTPTLNTAPIATQAPPPTLSEPTMTEEPTLIPYVPAVNTDFGGFIGNPDIPADTEAVIITANETDSVTSFGTVPQTGVPDITGIVTVLCVLIVITAALWIYVFLRKFKRDN